MSKRDDGAPEPVRRMPDGSPCWCVTDGDDGDWVHSPKCLTLRALTGGFDFATSPNTSTAARMSQRQKKAAFLRSYSQHGNQTRAASDVGVHRNTPDDWRAKDPAFNEQFVVAADMATDLLVDEARRRAAEGVEKPVYQNGKLVGHIREFSDTLLMFLIKGQRPAQYRDNSKIELTGPGGGPLQHTIAPIQSMNDHEKATLRRVIDEAIAAAKEPEPVG